MSGEIRRCLARSRSSLYFAARSAREVLSAARITGTMIPSSASTAMPISIEFDCTTRLPINFATATTNKPEVVGQTLRPGSTSMWAELRFINGYSPIRAAGAAREFATSIHGEINPDVGSNLLNHQAGSDGELALMGVDGVVVAQELSITPEPSSEWDLVVLTDEGNVFHRRGAPFARVRSVPSIDSRPNEQFALATITQVNDSRNFVNADIDVPAGDRPALLIFSRPYFRGYKAQIGNQKLAVTSYRGLFPVLEVPAGAHGRLTVRYRPAWLLWGGSLAAVCGLIVLFGIIAGCRYSSSGEAEPRS